MKELSICHIPGDGDLKQAFELRKIVFVDEQNVSMDAEFDGLDDQCDHLVALIGPRTVGTLRIRRVDHQLAKIERVAVLKTERGRQVGAKLMKAALGHLEDLGIDTVKIHAQTHAQTFYARLGFIADGDIFEEDGIPHIAMDKHLL